MTIKKPYHCLVWLLALYLFGCGKTQDTIRYTESPGTPAGLSPEQQLLSGKLDLENTVVQFARQGDTRRELVPVKTENQHDLHVYSITEKTGKGDLLHSGYLVAKEIPGAGTDLFAIPLGKGKIHYFHDRPGERAGLILKTKEAEYAFEDMAGRAMPCDALEPVCTDWYWITWNEDTGEIISELYLYTVCQDPCGAAGVGGTGGSEQGECNLSCAAAREVLNAVTYTLLDEVSVSAGAESAPDSNGIIRKPVIVDRHSVTYNWMLGYKSTYTLIFRGVIFKTTANAMWRWESLVFDNVRKTSGSTPPCFSASTTASVAGPVISFDKETASFSAAVTTTLFVTCAKNYEHDSKTVPVNGSYISHHLFR